MITTRAPRLNQDLSAPHAWPVFIPQQVAASVFKSLGRWLTPPGQQVLEDSLGYTLPAMLHAACKLELASHIHQSPRQHLTGAELGKAVGASGTDVKRLLHPLVNYGYFRNVASGSAEPLWANTELSDSLRSDHPNPMCAMVGHQAEDCLPAWGHLYESLKDKSTTAWKAAHGKDTWDYMRKHDGGKQGEQFNRAMTSVDGMSAFPVVHDYAWAQYSRIVDVGGSLGSMTAHILRGAAPANATGMIFDLPEVVAKAKSVWKDAAHADIAKRVTLVEGSFLEARTIPKAHDGDAWLMRVVLHDWTDADVVRILKNLHKSMAGTTARLVLVEQIVEVPQDHITVHYIMDLHMHVAFGGKERTRVEWRDLLKQSGFEMKEVKDTRSIFSVIEAVPV